MATGLVTIALAAPAQTSATARRMAAIAAGALDRSGWPGSRADRHADVDHGQRGRERRPTPPAGSTTAMLTSGAIASRPSRDECRIGKKIEGGEIELGAPAPRREGDVGSDPGRLAQGQRQRPCHHALGLTCIRASRRDVALADIAWIAARSARPSCFHGPGACPACCRPPTPSWRRSRTSRSRTW